MTNKSIDQARNIISDFKYFIEHNEEIGNINEDTTIGEFKVFLKDVEEDFLGVLSQVNDIVTKYSKQQLQTKR